MNDCPIVDEKNAIVTPCGNKIWYTQNTIHFCISAPVDENEVVLLRDKGLEFINKGCAVYIIIDLKHPTRPSFAVRKIWTDFLQNPKLKKVAIFGGNMFARTLASFVIATTHKKNIKIFSTENEVLAWLTNAEEV